MSADLMELRELLLHHAEKVKDRYEFPWLSQRPLSLSNANKFFLGAVMDYRIGANTAWENADELARMLGPENLWREIARMPEERWLRYRKEDGGLFHRLWQGRDNRSVARRTRRIAKNVVHRFNGDVRNIWRGRAADELPDVLKYDVEVNLGDSTATIDMIVLALRKYNHIEGTADVKADRHVIRVLGSLFDRDLNPGAAKYLARQIHPGKPWELDLPLFDIGREYCRPSYPKCEDCPLVEACLTAAD